MKTIIQHEELLIVKAGGEYRSHLALKGLNNINQLIFVMVLCFLCGTD
jgi:hypothetical protein